MNEKQTLVTLNIWTVYGTNSIAYPGMYVARLFKNEKVTDNFFVHEDLDTVRAWILDEAKSLGDNFHLYRLNRDPNDDPLILETWI